MKYTYIGNGAYLPGLPAVDLDDTKLGFDQRFLLGAAIEQGMYVPEKPAKQTTKPAARGQDAPTVPPAGQEADKTPDMPPTLPTGS